MNMEPPPSQRYYCVFNGWCPGIYTFEDDFQAQIYEHPQCAYQIHTTLEVAKQAWEVYFAPQLPYASKPRTYQDDEKPPLFQPPEICHLQRIALNALHKRHAETLNETLDYPTPGELVPEPPSRRPVVAISLRSLLKQACDRMQRPDPIYRTVRNTLLDGRWIYRHVVSIIPADSSEALVVTSRLSFDLNQSRDDAARLALRRLCRLQHSYVDDYNYDLVQRWKARYTEVASDLESMQETVDTLLRRNDKLAKAINPHQGRPSSSHD